MSVMTPFWLEHTHTHILCSQSGWAQNGLPMYDLPVWNIYCPMRGSSKADLSWPNVPHHLSSSKRILQPSFNHNMQQWRANTCFRGLNMFFSTLITHTSWYQPDRIFCVRKWQHGCRKGPVISHEGLEGYYGVYFYVKNSFLDGDAVSYETTLKGALLCSCIQHATNEDCV